MRNYLKKGAFIGLLLLTLTSGALILKNQFKEEVPEESFILYPADCPESVDHKDVICADTSERCSE